MCFRFEQFYLKLIEVDDLMYCFYVKNKLIYFQIFFCKIDSTVLSAKECGGKFFTRSRSVVLSGWFFCNFLCWRIFLLLMAFFCCDLAFFFTVAKNFDNL